MLTFFILQGEEGLNLLVKMIALKVYTNKKICEPEVLNLGLLAFMDHRQTRKFVACHFLIPPLFLLLLNYMQNSMYFREKF